MQSTMVPQIPLGGSGTESTYNQGCWHSRIRLHLNVAHVRGTFCPKVKAQTKFPKMHGFCTLKYLCPLFLVVFWVLRVALPRVPCRMPFEYWKNAISRTLFHSCRTLFRIRVTLFHIGGTLFRTPSSNRDEGGREEEGTEHQEVDLSSSSWCSCPVPSHSAGMPFHICTLVLVLAAQRCFKRYSTPVERYFTSAQHYSTLPKRDFTELGVRIGRVGLTESKSIAMTET